ncbi:hypothetical protein J6590_104835, partial [Homalodisca vitripennis]
MFGIYRYCSALPPLFLSACHDHPIEHKREELVSSPGHVVQYSHRSHSFRSVCLLLLVLFSSV